jgi:hypothetical protein
MNSKNTTGRFTRFINERKKFFANGCVKPKAFFPKRGDTDISVYLTESLIESDIWELGNQHIKPTLVGRADFDAYKVYDIGLSIIVDNTPTWHATLGPFPKVTSESDREAKEMRSHIATQLAKMSNAKRYTCP